MTSDVRMQNLLSDVTDAVLAGDNVDAVRARYDVSRMESDELIQLVERIHKTMPEVEPSAAFARRLKADLLGEARMGVLWRIRRLPARVQFAAVAALTGGFFILLRRIFLGEEAAQQDDGALQEKI